MKITYVHQYFTTPKEVGGTRSWEMGRRLASAGHEVTMIAAQSRPRPGMPATGWFVESEGGMTVHRVVVDYSNHMAYKDRTRAFLRFAWKAALRAATVEADVVFGTSTPLTIALPGVYAARRQKVPFVFEVRDLWPDVPIAIGALRGRPRIAIARALERFAYKNASHVVALSPGIRDGVVAKGYPIERIHLIPNACDVALFARDERAGSSLRASLGWLGDRPLVLYAGTLGRINGVGYLVRLAEACSSFDPEVRFLVIGDGAEADAIRAQAHQAGVLGETFFMMKPIPKEEVPVWLSAATLGVSLFVDEPVMWANSANKFFDTLAAERPIAVNYEGWQADLLRETGAGLVLPAGDPVRAASVTAAAVRDEEFLRKAREAAAALSRERFSRDLLAQELEQVLTRASQEPRKVRARTMHPRV